MGFCPRATMFFDAAGYGWTESHISTRATDLASLRSAAHRLAGLRAALLGRFASLRWLRYSLDDAARDSMIDGPLADTPTPVDAENTAAPWKAILLRVEGASTQSLYRHTLYLAGAPDDVRGDPEGERRGGVWWGKFADYKAELLGGAWGSRRLIRGGPETVETPILEMFNAAGQCVIRSPGYVLRVGDTCHIRNARVSSGTAPNGDYTVRLEIDRNLFVVSEIPHDFVYTRGGFARKRLVGIVPYSQITVVGEGSRKRGKRYFPVSWHIPGDLMFPLQPCGQIVDLLHSCYTADVRFVKGSQATKNVRWYYCEDDAKPAPYGLFGSLAWHDPTVQSSDLGEVPGTREWDEGKNKLRYKGACHIGTADQWANGLTEEEAQDRPALPDCCRPVMGGVGLVGSAPIVVVNSYATQGRVYAGGHAPFYVYEPYHLYGYLVIYGAAWWRQVVTYYPSGYLQIIGSAPTGRTLRTNPTGFGVFRGGAPFRPVLYTEPMGGLRIQGIAEPVSSFEFSAGGGLEVFGTVIPRSEFPEEPTGRDKITGTARVRSVLTVEPAGQVEVFGTAPILVTATTEATGGLTLTGHVVPTKAPQYVGTIQVFIHGSATWAPIFNTAGPRYLVLRGSAPFAFYGPGGVPQVGPAGGHLTLGGSATAGTGTAGGSVYGRLAAGDDVYFLGSRGFRSGRARQVVREWRGI